MNAKHVLTRLLVQVGGQTASQVSSTYLVKSSAQPNGGPPFPSLPFVNGFKWNLNMHKGYRYYCILAIVV